MHLPASHSALAADLPLQICQALFEAEVYWGSITALALVFQVKFA